MANSRKSGLVETEQSVKDVRLLDEKSARSTKYFMKKLKKADIQLTASHQLKTTNPGDKLNIRVIIPTTKGEKRRESHQGWSVKDVKKKHGIFGRDRFTSRQNAKHQQIEHELIMDGLSKRNGFK